MATYLMATLHAGHKPGGLRQRKLLAGAGRDGTGIFLILASMQRKGQKRGVLMPR